MIDYSKSEGHTPGPWRESNGIFAIVDFQNRAIVLDLAEWMTASERDANAALIAAAPELLAENKQLREALEIALKTLQDIQGKYYGDPIPDSVFEAVTSALK